MRNLKTLTEGAIQDFKLELESGDFSDIEAEDFVYMVADFYTPTSMNELIELVRNGLGSAFELPQSGLYINKVERKKLLMRNIFNHIVGELSKVLQSDEEE